VSKCRPPITSDTARQTESSSTCSGTRGCLDEFRVEVVDERDGAHFVLHPTTGREAIDAFYHPFSAARAALNGKRWAA
jgi:hypothetical protein